jgi:hypothetical protein
VSDIIKPGQNEGNFSTPSSESLIQSVPHNGNLSPEEGGETAVNEQQGPLREDILTVPEHIGDLAIATESSSKVWRRPLAALAVLGIAVGAFFATSSSEDSDRPQLETQPTEVSTPDTTDKDIETPPSTLESQIENKAFGNINLSGVSLGSHYITATRPNLEQIKVAYLNGQDTNELVSSALSLLACYLTTGSEDCKVGFSNNTAVQRALEQFRQIEVEPLLSNPSNADMQIAIFDDPEDPAIFTTHSDEFGREIFELSTGTLYFGRYIDHTGTNEWQGPETRATGILESRVNSMSFYVEPVGDQSLTIVRFEWDIQPVESAG